MKKEVGLISLSATVLLIVVLGVGVVQVLRYRQIQASQVTNGNEVSSKPSGLLVALNAPTDTTAQGVMVNYLNAQGVAVRTRSIPNATIKTTNFQVVQDDVFVYTEQGDEPGLRRMDESGSLSAMVDIHRGVSGEDFWLVSSDGQRLAWSETTVDQGMTTSVLFSTGIDGSDQQQVASVSEVGEFYLRPVAWMEIEPDEWGVWYVKQLIGLGGYVVLVDPLGPIFVNGQIISADAATSHFTGSQQPTTIRVTEQGLVLSANDQSHLLVGAGQAAEGTWSPNQQFVAVAEAAGNPEDEAGWAEIWDVNKDTAVRVSPEVMGNILHILGWLDQDTLALSVLDADHPLQSKMYVVQADGSFFRKVWDGYPIGVVPVSE